MKLLVSWLGRAVSTLLFYGPRWIPRGLAYFVAFLWYDLFRIRRDVVLNNLAIAFPELSLGERVRLGRTAMRNWALNFVEYSHLAHLDHSNFQGAFEFINTERMDEVLARGHGALLLTLHLGHGDLATAGLSLRGYPMVLVSKSFKVKWLNDLWFGLRSRSGTRFVPDRNSSYALLKALKSGGMVAIPLDQFTGPPIGVRTRFFGRETGTAAGMAVMAERSGAPVVLVYTIRLPDGRHRVEFVREVPLVEGDAEATTQRFCDELEALVRRYPEQWMWIHKRWKTFKY